jgi:hypothetical protein
MNGLRAVVLIGMAGLAGCEHVEWHRPGADAATTETDIRECQQQARLDTQRALVPYADMYGRGSLSPMQCSWPVDRHRSLGLAGCPAVGPYGTPLPAGGIASRRVRLEDQLTSRCLRERGYELTPVDEIEGRATDPATVTPAK